MPNRNRVKKELFGVLFDEKSDVFRRRKPCKSTNTRLTLIESLNKAFPGIIDAIDRMKQDDYRAVAHKMQRTESNFIFNQVCKRLLEKDIFIATIHDSIVTLPINENVVKNTMMEEFQKLGVIPKLKVERYSDYCLAA